METFGQLVTRLREERKLTQAKLAIRAECDTDTIARVERGRGTWFRRTARSVYLALSDVAPLSSEDAMSYFELGKFNPADELIERDIAEGRILVGTRAAKLEPAPADLVELLNKLLYSFGEARTRQLMRTVLSLAIDQETRSAPGTVPAAVAIDFEDPSSGLRGKMYTPVDPPPGSPSATSRRRKSG